MSRINFLFSGVILLLATMAALVGTARALRITAPPELADFYIPTPEFFCMPEKHAVEGPIVFVSSFTEEQLRNESFRVDGLIIIETSGRVEISFDEKGDWWPSRWRKRGAAAVVIINSVTHIAGGGEVLVPGWSVCSDVLPMQLFEVGTLNGKNLTDILEQNKNITVMGKLTPGDPNPWRQIRRGWFTVLFRIFFTLMSGATSTLALTKLIAYVAKYGVQMSVPQFCLFSTFLVALFRTIYHALDPIYFGFVFTAVQAHALSTITFPFDLINTLLMSLYWKELMDKSKLRVNHFLGKLKWVFVAVSVITLGLEIASTAFRAAGATLGIFTTIVAIVYVAVSIAMCVLFFYNGFKVLRYMKLSESQYNLRHVDRKRSRKTLRRASVFILMSAIFNIIWVIGFIMAALSSVFWDPVGMHATWTTLWTGVTGAAFSQVLAFKFPSGSQESSVVITGATSSPTFSRSNSTTTSRQNSREALA